MDWTDFNITFFFSKYLGPQSWKLRQPFKDIPSIYSEGGHHRDKLGQSLVHILVFYHLSVQRPQHEWFSHQSIVSILPRCLLLCLWSHKTSSQLNSDKVYKTSVACYWLPNANFVSKIKQKSLALSMDNGSLWGNVQYW